MNTIVRRHYPVAKLPEDLRAEFRGSLPDDALVTVTVAVDKKPKKSSSKTRFLFSELLREKRNVYKDEKEVIDYINALREDRIDQ